MRDPRYREARTAREVYDSQRAKLKLEILAGKLIPIEEFERRMSNLCSDIRTAFLGLGSQLAPFLEGQSVMRIKMQVDAAVESHLRILSRGGDDTEVP